MMNFFPDEKQTAILMSFPYRYGILDQVRILPPLGGYCGIRQWLMNLTRQGWLRCHFVGPQTECESVCNKYCSL